MLRKHKDAQDVFCLFYIFVLECHVNSVLKKLMKATFQVFCV